MARPEHDPTEETRSRVSIAAGGGMLHEEIAQALGICRSTLEKHYEVELSEGAYAKRLDVLAALYRSATGDKPNAAAARAYLDHEPPSATPPQNPDDAGTGKLGKKDQANVDARNAGVGTDWEQLLRPGARPN